MNTCLQNLIHSEYFIKILFSKINLISKKTPITYQFMKLCLQTIEENNIKVIYPKDFKDKFSSKHHMFKGYRQQDTQEFCRILLEDMNTELNEVKHPSPYKELTTINKTKLQCNKEFDDNFKEKENSLIMECFYSQLINIFKCECGFETFSFEKILDIPLLLQKNNKKIKIKELLDEYFEEETIQFTTKCENCHRKKQHKKVVKFTQPPNILILSLQRIIGKIGKKNDCYVKFPEELDISDYIDEDCGYKNDNKYILYGVGNHMGKMDFGHYYAYIKLNDDQWYEFNDSRVIPYTDIEKSSSSAYILFYKKWKINK